jgi:hypothetical protein
MTFSNEYENGPKFYSNCNLNRGLGKRRLQNCILVKKLDQSFFETLENRDPRPDYFLKYKHGPVAVIENRIVHQHCHKKLERGCKTVGNISKVGNKAIVCQHGGWNAHQLIENNIQNCLKLYKKS